MGEGRPVSLFFRELDIDIGTATIPAIAVITCMAMVADVQPGFPTALCANKNPKHWKKITKAGAMCFAFRAENMTTIIPTV